MRIQIIMFLLFASVILLAAHVFVYAWLIRIFPTLSGGQRATLLGTLMFLSVSFIFASVLVHLFEYQVVRFFYLLAGWWLGFLTNLVLALIAAWFVVFLGKLFSLSMPLSSVGLVMISIAALVSVYGAWNAFHPQLKEITVQIPNLPEEWQGKKVVQLSDVHLGSVYQADFLRTIVNQVNAVQPEAVFITGDLFDGMDGALDTLVGPFQDMHSPRGTFFVTGNHETYLGVQAALNALEGTGIHILDGQIVDLGGLKVVGIGYPERGAADDTLETLRLLQPQFAGSPTVLLYHAPIHTDEFAAAGINLQLSGHTHLGQQYPFNLITRLMYHGLDYGLHESGDYAIYTTNGVGTWGPAMRIGNTPEIVIITLEKK
jgi:predicted MPP superfamily phosphohydrolase